VASVQVEVVARVLAVAEAVVVVGSVVEVVVKRSRSVFFVKNLCLPSNVLWLEFELEFKSEFPITRL
jgi:hypothetical protein